MKRLAFISFLLVATLGLAACAVPVQPAATPVLPAETPEATEEESTEEDAAEGDMDEAAIEDASNDIVDFAIAAGDFETLVAAVSAAGLVDTLRGEGPFTVFAPTDDAFALLPEGTMEALLADPEGDLTQILLYHVLPGAVMAADVSDGLEAETLQGSSVSFTVDGDRVMIEDASIIATDILVSNGVIHVIDAVILPPVE